MFHVYLQSVGKCSFRFSQEHTPLLVKFLLGTAHTVSDGEKFVGHFTFRLSAAYSRSRAAAPSFRASPSPLPLVTHLPNGGRLHAYAIAIGNSSSGQAS